MYAVVLHFLDETDRFQLGLFLKVRNGCLFLQISEVGRKALIVLLRLEYGFSPNHVNSLFVNPSHRSVLLDIIGNSLNWHLRSGFVPFVVDIRSWYIFWLVAELICVHLVGLPRNRRF